MKKYTRILLSGMLALCMMCLGLCLTGCGESIELYQENNIYEVAPGKTLQLSVKKNKLDKAAIIEYVVDGDATISTEGLLTANKDAKVQSLIKVYAKSDKVKSKQIIITVVDLKPESITLNSDGQNIANNSINFSVSYNPTYATLKDYTLSVTKINNEALTDNNNNWVVINGNVMTLNSDAEIPAGTTFEITATLNCDANVKDSIVITKIDPKKTTYIIGSNVSIITSIDSNKYVDIVAYNELNEEIENYALNQFTYTSSNEDVATISSDGKIVPKGHGTTQVVAKSIANENVTTTFKVYVMVTPENINIKNVKVDTFSYSKNSDLVLNIDATNTTYENKCSKVFDYKFEMVDGSYSGEQVATVSGGKITFNKTGKVKVTVVSNSSLNNVATKNYEKSKEIIVDVNDGINIHSVSEFVAYAKQTTNIVVNIASDLILTSEENFGLVDGIYPSLELRGDRIINGNGFVLSTLNLPLCDSENKGNDLLYFARKTENTPFKVQINNFEIVGCGSLDGNYDGNVTADKGRRVLNAKYEYCHTFRRGIRIYGDKYDEGRAYVKDLKLENVKVSGFDVGIRIEHAVDGYLSDINISKCFSNGMEFNQNTLTLNNVTLGQVGAFGIEMTSDDIQEKTTADPKACAGKDYNETPSLKLTGYINSGNYNNGTSTTYMSALTSKLGMSVPSLVDSIIKGTIDYIMSEAGVTGETKTNLETKLSTVMNKCLKRNGNDMNFYLLIFVNRGEITTYNEGNKTGKFAQYTSNDDNMINVNDILSNLAQNPEDTTYQNYQYIQMDLDTQDLSKGGNLGQVILVNQAYVESK